MSVGVLWPINQKVLYHFENTSDSSGNGKTLSGSATFVNGRFGMGAKTTSTKNLYRLDSAGISTAADTTIMFWLKLDALPGVGSVLTVFTLYSAQPQGHRLRFSNVSGTYYFVGEVGKSTNKITTSIAMPMDATKYHHIAVTLAHSARVLKYFFDGSQIAEVPLGTQIISEDSSYIAFGESFGISGIFDEAAVYQETKTAQWIRKYVAWATGKLL